MVNLLCDSLLPVGNQPIVIARGGLSGLLPEGTQGAIDMAKITSLPDLVILCNLEMTKSGTGLCLSSIRLDNATNMAHADKTGAKTYNILGMDVTGFFTVDYTDEEIEQNNMNFCEYEIELHLLLIASLL